ncbi:hypothetical protein SKAU_G00196020 [Synaphobranchus kaupii]|uniref:C2H2-type domain-containing protein n=1 Tax=Synaphobranchus kaupii TaxID=118154 RepID=A0A9Q1FEG9_SYNKA|nr:hypothetical protein SKAU_G00196020 [Synaphobranchus kaupii]
MVRWTVDPEQAFQSLKRALCSSPVLVTSDFSMEMVVHTDATYVNEFALDRFAFTVMPKRSRKSYALKLVWKRRLETAAKEDKLSIPDRPGKTGSESHVTREVDLAVQRDEGEESSAGEGVESAMCAVHTQEALDTGKGPSTTDNKQTGPPVSPDVSPVSGSPAAQGEAGEAPESEACAPLCEEEWYAPITDDLLSSSAEDSDGSLEGSNAEEKQGGMSRSLRSRKQPPVASERGPLQPGERYCHVCSLCGKVFGSLTKLTAHYQGVHKGEKPYSCDVCGKRYKSAYGLEGHRRVHTGETPYACGRCGQRFRLLFQLRTHEAGRCGGDGLGCAVCGKVLATLASLDTHRRIHTDERPHTCASCGKRFRTRGNLRRHLPVHSKSKPLRCAVCGKELKNLITLRSHEQIHTGSMPHTCTRCGESFRWRVQLQRHLQSHRLE